MLLTLVSGPARAVSPGYPLRIVPLNENSAASSVENCSPTGPERRQQGDMLSKLTGTFH